jgi:hypothetical protein
MFTYWIAMELLVSKTTPFFGMTIFRIPGSVVFEARSTINKYNKYNHC